MLLGNCVSLASFKFKFKSFKYAAEAAARVTLRAAVLGFPDHEQP